MNMRYDILYICNNFSYFLAERLFERKGTSVGVIVSGPREMRQEVAAICSSGLADNLNFESIGFTW